VLVDQEQIMRAIEAGDADTLRGLIASLPATVAAGSALGMVESPKLATRLMGLNCIAADLARGLAVELARPLAEAIHAVALAHLDDPDPIPGFAATQAGAAADALADALALMGKHENVVALARAAPGYLRGCANDDLHKRMNSDREISLRLKAATALISLGRLEEAELELDALAAEGAATHPSFNFVRDRLDARLRPATLLADRLSADEQAIASHKQTQLMMLESISTVMKDISDVMRSDGHEDSAPATPLSEGQALFDALRQQLEAEPQPTSAREVFDRSEMSELKRMLRFDRSEFSQWRDRMRKAQAIFLDPVVGHDPAQLSESLSTLLEANAWFEANGHREEAQTALWSIHLCQKRLGRVEQALVILHDLAARLEAERALISDPVRRAGVAASFPRLYSCLAGMCAELDDPKGMLAAIEAAKGRALADLLTHRDGAAADEAALQLDPAELERLTGVLGIHYLSFLVDESTSYAVLVTKAGCWHWKQVPLGRAALTKLANIDPRSWGKKTLFGEVPAPTRELAPLVAWLMPLLETGEIGPDDHLVYSADEHLHQFPLHAVELGGEPLVAHLTLITRVHGLAALRRLASRPARRPSQALALFVPAADEGELAAKRAAFAATAAALAEFLPTKVPDGPSIDQDYMAGLRAPETLVHMSGHGVFPEEGMKGISEDIPPNSYEFRTRCADPQGMKPVAT
jgi:hypothetical protein